MKTEIPKLEKKLAEMRAKLADYRHDRFYRTRNRLTCMIADCEKMLIHARILVLQGDYGEHLYKCK